MIRLPLASVVYCSRPLEPSETAGAAAEALLAVISKPKTREVINDGVVFMIDGKAGCTKCPERVGR
jgi:hypothetical protein